MALKSILALWNRPAPSDLTARFNEAIQQYLIMYHFLEHGRITADLAHDDPGITECPCCTADASFSGPLVKVWEQFSKSLRQDWALSTSVLGLR